MRSQVAIVGVACLGLTSLWVPTSYAQVARTEVHAIPTVTMADRQFLKGDKNGTQVTIAGVLRIPRLGTDRLPAVILVHGSGGVGGNVDRWSSELNSIGLATFTMDAFTARGIQSTGANQALRELAPPHSITSSAQTLCTYAWTGRGELCRFYPILCPLLHDLHRG